MGGGAGVRGGVDTPTSLSSWPRDVNGTIDGEALCCIPLDAATIAARDPLRESDLAGSECTFAVADGPMDPTCEGATEGVTDEGVTDGPA